MDYSQATFHIKGNFVVYTKDTEAKPVGQSKRQSPNRRRQTFKRRPKDLPKLCRWQQKCTRTTCTYIHLPPEFLEGARRPYRLCWAHPKCRASRCPYIHYTVEKDNPPPPLSTMTTPLRHHQPPHTSHHRPSGQHRCPATYHRVLSAPLAAHSLLTGTRTTSSRTCATRFYAGVLDLCS